MLRSIERGLPLCEWENLTVGMIFGFIIEFNNEQLDEDETEAREATQADFDKF